MAAITRSAVDQLLRYYAFLGAILAWIAHLLIAYTLVPVACAHTDLWIHLTTVITLAVAAGSTFAAWVLLKRTREGHSLSEETSSYTARLSLLMNPIFIFAIVLQAMAPFFMNPCDRTF
jgi:hypothetical protein